MNLKLRNDKTFSLVVTRSTFPEQRLVIELTQSEAAWVQFKMADEAWRKRRSAIFSRGFEYVEFVTIRKSLS